jgi:hypothetical protein
MRSPPTKSHSQGTYVPGLASTRVQFQAARPLSDTKMSTARALAMVYLRFTTLVPVMSVDDWRTLG